MELEVLLEIRMAKVALRCKALTHQCPRIADVRSGGRKTSLPMKVKSYLGVNIHNDVVTAICHFFLVRIEITVEATS